VRKFLRKFALPLALATTPFLVVGGAYVFDYRWGGENIHVVEFLVLDRGRQNGDLWFHKRFLYVGDYDFSGRLGCPTNGREGVAVVDVRDPENPVAIARLAVPSGVWTEDVTVYTAEVGRFRGRDIAVAGLQICGGAPSDPLYQHGITLWDVTAPAHPRRLAHLDTGCCSVGVHNVEVAHRRDLGRMFAYVTVPGSAETDRRRRGGFRLVDITDPTKPREVSSWGSAADLARVPHRLRGCIRRSFAHAAEPSADGRLAFVSHWDAGVITLDVTDPTRPRYRGQTAYPRNADGDAHSAVYDESRRLLFTADEDFCPVPRDGTEGGWGFLRIYDAADVGAPRQIGEFKTAHSLSTESSADRAYSIHMPVLVGSDLYASWYGDGVRVIDTSDPRSPREVASYDSAAYRGDAVAIWGVAVDPRRGLIYASDMGTGVWILERD
jgi:hypothetical protein